MRPRHIRAVLLAVVMVLSIMGGGLATADYSSSPSIDTSASDDTSTTSETRDGDNVTIALGGNDSWSYQYVAATNDSKVEMEHDADGTLVYANSSANQVNWNATDADGHFNVTFSEEQLADLEHTPGENVSVNVTFINDSTNDTLTKTHATLYAETDNNTVESIGDGDVGEDAETSDEDALVGSDDFTSLDYSDLDVSSDGDHVVLVASNGSVGDDLGLATDDTNPVPFVGGAAESGDRIWTAPVTVTDGDTTRVVFPYEGEAPDDVDSDDTYAVRKDVGGESAIEINKGDAFEDSDTLDVTGTLNAGLGEVPTLKFVQQKVMG